MILRNGFPSILHNSRWWLSANRAHVEDFLFDSALITSVQGTSTNISESTGSVVRVVSVSTSSTTQNQSTANITITRSVSGFSQNISQAFADAFSPITIVVSGTSTNISQATLTAQSGAIRLVQGSSYTVNQSLATAFRETAYQRFTNTSLEEETEMYYLIIEAIG